MSSFVVAVLVAVALVLAVSGVRWFERSRGIPEGQSLPRVVFSAEAQSGLRLGVSTTIRFRVTNLGPEGIARLSVRAEGPWTAFHVEVVDVDGVFRMSGDAGWFLFGQSVPAGKTCTLIVRVVPRATGSYHFEFAPYDAGVHLPDAEGRPAQASADLEVLP